MDVRSKALEHGIETDFVDAHGQWREVGVATLQAILDTTAPPSKHSFLSGPVVMRTGQPLSPQIGGSAVLPVDWAVSRDGREEIARGRFDQRPFACPALLEPGVYRLDLIDAEGACDEGILVVSPQRAFAGDFDRVWVLTIQLYSLRSASNWGIGDFTDLMTMIRIGAKAGAAGIGLNPLHALFDNHPADCSPYSPNSRLFLNPLYIDVGRAPNLPAGFLSDHADILDTLRKTDLVDYSAVADLKWSALRSAFEQFLAHGSPADVGDFEKFRHDRGENLRRFACFEFLRRRFPGPWWDWPPEWRIPDDDRLDRLRRGADAHAIAYFEFLQWLADRQLRQCTDLAAEFKMPVGLYLDVAVGVKADGFDAWSAQSVISRHASVGAPPDLLNTAGQDWGLAGFSAAGLEQTLFRPFRDMIAASMRYASAIRLDHVMGLQRLYLIPSGFSPKHGAYVRMPFEALLAVTAIESQKYRCVVIGEDLGTVPEGLRGYLADYGIWSYRVMIFERGDDGSFRSSDHYAGDALVTFSTHDLPTFAGWKAGHDLMTKRGLGIDPGETDEQRHRALASFAATAQRPVADIGFDDVIGFLSRTPSRILAIAVEDLLDVMDQPNVPGTVDEHPNWRRKLPVTIETFAAGPDIERLRRGLGTRRSTAPGPI
jgi:4-alpha-glucanotransferase